MTQQNKNIKTRVGITILIGIAVLFIFIIIIGTDDYLFSKTYNLYIYIENTTGLVKGVPVTLGGYKIGDVQEVEFVPSNKREAIKIKLRVLNEYQNRITLSSHAEVSSIGILGDKFINISIGIPGETIVPPNSTLPVIPKMNFENIADKMGPGIEHLNNILKNASSVSDSIAAGKGSIGKLLLDGRAEKKITSLLDNINLIASDIKNGKGSLGKLISNDELYAGLKEASGDAARLLSEIKGGKGTLGKLIANDSLYNNLNSAGSKLSRFLESADKDSSVVKGLISDKNMYNNLMKSITNLNNLLEDIKEHPDRYLKVSVF